MNRNLPAPVLMLIVALAAASIAPGSAIGDANGVAVCTASGDQLTPSVAPDGAGGAIVAWHDLRPTVAAGGVCFAQRVNAAGVAQWALNGVPLSTTGDFSDPTAPAIASDGAGGAFLAYGGSSAPPRAQRVNAAGSPQWGADGVALTTTAATRDLAIVRDIGGAGGAIAVWRQDSGLSGTPDIYAQKVDAAGTLQWGPTGVGVATTSMNSETLPALISDGAGGAIVTWFNGTNGCRVQRLNSAGTTIWSTTPLSSVSNNRRPAIVTDGAGGAVVGWAAGNTGIYVQRVNSLGDKLWPPNNTGVMLCSAGNQCAMIPDGAGGATVTWQDFRTGTNYNIFAQRVNGAGAPQWLMNGVPVCAVQDDQLAPVIVPDAGTGAVITWYDHRTPFTGDDIYAQHIDAAGLSQWTPDGSPLCTAADTSRIPRSRSTGRGARSSHGRTGAAAPATTSTSSTSMPAARPCRCRTGARACGRLVRGRTRSSIACDSHSSCRPPLRCAWTSSMSGAGAFATTISGCCRRGSTRSPGTAVRATGARQGRGSTSCARPARASRCRRR